MDLERDPAAEHRKALHGTSQSRQRAGISVLMPQVYLTAAAAIQHQKHLPPEAGFTWWFRCVFLLSSTI